jgi:hypothetical protein
MHRSNIVAPESLDTSNLELKASRRDRFYRTKHNCLALDCSRFRDRMVRIRELALVVDMIGDFVDHDIPQKGLE